MPRKSDTSPLANRQMKPEPEHNLQLVTVRTTRCDYCNQRNTDILLDCVECNFRICRKCIGQGILDNVAHHSGASARKDWDKLFDQKLNPTQTTGAQPENMPQSKPGPLAVSGGAAPSPSYQSRQALSNSPLGSQHSGRASTPAYRTYTPGSGGAPRPSPPQLGLPVIGAQTAPVPPFYQCVQGSDGRFYPITTAQAAYSGYYGASQPGSSFEALQYSSIGPPYQVHNPHNIYGPGRPLPQSLRPDQHAGHFRHASASTTGHAAASPATQGYLSPSEWHPVPHGFGHFTESFERTNLVLRSPTRTWPTQAPTNVEHPAQYGGNSTQYDYAADASPQPVEMAAQHAQTVASDRDNSQPLPDSTPRMEESLFVTQRSARPRRVMEATRTTSESSYRPSSQSSQSGPTPEPSPEKREDVTHDDDEDGIRNLAAAAGEAHRIFNEQAHAERQAREDIDRNAQHITGMQKQELDKARDFAESMAREAQQQARQMTEKQSRESEERAREAEERKTQDLKEQITRELEEKQAREIAQKLAQIEQEKQEAVELAERRARFAEQRAREYAYGITAQVADWTNTGPQEVMRKALQEAQSGAHPHPAQPDMPGHPESQACAAIKEQGGGAAPLLSRRRPNHEVAAALAAQRERARSPGAAMAAAAQDRSSRQPGRPKLQASTPIKVEDGAAPSSSRRRPNHEVAAAPAAQKEHVQTPATRFAPVLRLSRPQPQATTPPKDPNRSFQEALARSNPGLFAAVADTHAERPGTTGSQRFNTSTEPRLPVSQTHALDDQAQPATETTGRRPAIPEKPARRPLPSSRLASRAPTAPGAPATPAKGAGLSKKRPHPLSPAGDTPAGDTPAGDKPAIGATTGGTAAGGTPIPGSEEVQEALSGNPAVARARRQDGEVVALDMVDTANTMMALSRDRSHVRHPDGTRGVDGRSRPEVRANDEEVRRQREAIVGLVAADEGEKKPEKKKRQRKDDDGGGGGGDGGAGSGGVKAKRGGGGGLHFFR